MTTIVVSEAPSRTNAHSSPFSSNSGGRLGLMLRMEHWLDKFTYVTLADQWPGYRPVKGSRFPMRLARQAAGGLIKTYPDVWFILVGRRVERAFGLTGRTPLHCWLETEWGKVAVMLHPSGVVRRYNDTDYLFSALNFLRNAAFAEEKEV